MENLVLDQKSKNALTAYIADKFIVHYEKAIFEEIIKSIDAGDQHQLDWYRSFGESFRAIAMNVHAYRKGLEFGFIDVAFDKYGWFQRPVFLDREDLTFGDTSRHGNHSHIYLGRGLNFTWTYGLNYSYGVAGGCYGLSVYGKQFRSRQDAFHAALLDLKAKMSAKVGSTDTTNDKQPIILATLRDIEKAQLDMVQLTLF